MTHDQLVRDFMRAVYEIGKPYHGWADADKIMQRIGLEPSSVVDIKKPTTEDDRLYTRLARRCEERGYINKTVDRYRAVRITRTGKQYVERGFRGM
jgi:hypothetical protein